MSTEDMNFVINIEFLKGRQNEIVVKELYVAAKNVPFLEPLQHDVTRFQWNRAQLGGRKHRLPRSVHVRERGGNRVRSPLLLRHYKMQISHPTTGSPYS